MANALSLDNVKLDIIRDILANPGWLGSIENKANINILDAEVNIGDNNYTVLDKATATALTVKTDTTVVADKGVRHTVSATTVYYPQPVKYFPSEYEKQVRNGSLQATVTKDAIVQKDAAMVAVEKIIIDALSDGALTLTDTLTTGQVNFLAEDLGEQADNMVVFGNVLGQFVAKNGGMLPNWVIAEPNAYGYLTGYSNQTTSTIVQTPGGATAFTIRGIPMYPEGNGDAAKWGAVSKPCLLMGANRHIVFRAHEINMGQPVFDESSMLWTVPLGFTFTYAVDFTGTTGLALGIGEVLNPGS